VAQYIVGNKVEELQKEFLQPGGYKPSVIDGALYSNEHKFQRIRELPTKSYKVKT
jgi:hypothetical protein